MIAFDKPSIFVKTADLCRFITSIVGFELNRGSNSSITSFEKSKVPPPISFSIIYSDSTPSFGVFTLAIITSAFSKLVTSNSLDGLVSKPCKNTFVRFCKGKKFFMFFKSTRDFF